ncbi:FG-GAP repeat domain-containing protein, partial [Hymenobacter sp. IS2118]|uniref:FG-GAP repeat domain-containing protein n=1 Tax=Hymenobacter sp. IS2118 TaxID=1505605 RepID=UPI0009E01534
MLKHLLSLSPPLTGGRAALLLALSLGLAPTAFGQVTFDPAVSYGAGATPVSVAVGDFNADGRPDLVTANFDSGNVSVLLAEAGGGFAAAVNYGTGDGPVSVAVGDFNTDGRPDLAVANLYNGNVAVLLAQAGGTFAGAVNYGAGDGPRSVAVGDFNADGRPDLAVANLYNGNVAVLLAQAGGTFAGAVNYGAGDGPRSVAVGDFNADGRPDLAVANLYNDNVSVLLAQAGGGFAAAVSYGAGATPISVAVGDFNADGRPDLATANVDGGNVSVLLAQAGGTFAAPVSYGAGVRPFSVAVGDFNADDIPDLAVANANGDNVSVLLGQAGGTFAGAVNYGTGVGPYRSPYSVAVGDFNADGRPDLVTANYDGGNVSVLLAEAGGSFAAAISYGVGSGPFSVAVGDFNADSRPDLAVANYGSSNVSVLLNTTETETDLTISDTRTIEAGTYRNITITGPNGNATLAGNIEVTGALTVQDAGTLADGCRIITGSGTFALAAGGTLAICRPRGILAVGDPQGNIGTVRVTGGRSFSPDASYVYNGSDATGSGLPGQVRNLSITVPGNVALSAPTSVSQTLTLSSTGNLVLAGNALTLLSDASGTALVVNSGTGRVLGRTATVQRHLSTENRGLGYRHYSAPVTGSTVADLATPGFAPEVSRAAAYNASATPGKITPFPTVFGYDQSRVTRTSTYAPFDRGFVVPAGLGSALEVGRGYAVQLAGTEKVAFTGTLNTGDYDVALSRVGENPAAGWALVGNPYPAPIDGAELLGLGEATNAPGLDRSFYVVESSGPYTSTYRAFVAGFEGGEQNPLIAAGQGFFVRVSSSETSGEVRFRDEQRLTDFETQVRMSRGTTSTQPTVGLALRGATGPADKLFVYAAAPATASFDSGYDAWKLSNTTGLNLSSRSATGEALSIDGRPAFTAATRIA